jgi:hypothetical protein
MEPAASQGPGPENRSVSEAPKAPPPGATSHPAENRISTLVGDRLCIKCGYNLTGQPVLREPHYEMLIVRCPECGTVASMQEYPLLGRWAGRWAAVAAALWFLLGFALLLASAGILLGITSGITGFACQPYAQRLAEQQLAWLEQQDPNTVGQNVQWMLSQPPNPYWGVDQGWWADQDPAQLLQEAGGWAGAVDLGAIAHWPWLALVAVPIGCFWAVALLHLRKRSLFIFGGIVVTVAGAFAVIAHYQSAGTQAWGWTTAMSLAQRQIGPPITAMTLGFALIPLSIGLAVGRPIVRGLVRALLPPRLRSPLALLWTTQGLKPPCPSGGRARAAK